MKEVSIYTDGACSGNPGPGGWCAILIYKKHKKEIFGGEKETTNNQMELKAVIEGLKMLKEKCAVNLYSDSSYVVNAFNQGWINDWVGKGWRKADKNQVKNKPFWKELYDLSMKHDIKWIKVKGHADNALNNRCDELAVEQSILFKKDL